jgi:hypothetical protein
MAAQGTGQGQLSVRGHMLLATSAPVRWCY